LCAKCFRNIARENDESRNDGTLEGPGLEVIYQGGPPRVRVLGFRAHYARE